MKKVFICIIFVICSLIISGWAYADTKVGVKYSDVDAAPPEGTPPDSAPPTNSPYDSAPPTGVAPDVASPAYMSSDTETSSQGTASKTSASYK